MSHTPRLTLIGMYNFDSNLFANLSLPTGIDKTVAINSLLLAYGEKPVLYTNVDFMKFAIGAWSNKWSASITKINTALTAEYNAIHNYDRHEEYTDTDDVDESSTDSTTSETESTITGSSTTEQTTSAYNVSTYQPADKQVGSDTTGSSAEGSVSVTGSKTMDRTFEHDAHLYGNIGVTTSQQMITEELQLRENHNIYDIIADLFSRELLLYTF